jgi:hypothetical protein
MSTATPDPRLRPVAELLADYMSHSPAVNLPGADGVLVEDVLAEYEVLAARGQVPTEAELCARHPDLAARLAAFFHLQHPSDAG